VFLSAELDGGEEEAVVFNERRSEAARRRLRSSLDMV
jgi:hypothetical protein